MESIKNKEYCKSESNIGSQNNNKIKDRNEINMNNNNNKGTLKKQMFDFIFIIGKGGFGKVINKII